jgi:hypothetical protein
LRCWWVTPPNWTMRNLLSQSERRPGKVIREALTAMKIQVAIHRLHFHLQREDEDGRSVVLLNVSILPHHHTVPQSRIPRFAAGKVFLTFLCRYIIPWISNLTKGILCVQCR